MIWGWRRQGAKCVWGSVFWWMKQAPLCGGVAALIAFSIVEDESQSSQEAHMQQQLFAVASFFC